MRAKVRITPTTCLYCSWTYRERPKHAWLALLQHHVSEHPRKPRPASPDELTILTGNWQFAAVRHRKSGEVGDYVREVDAFVALSHYLDAHGLTNTPADPMYKWYIAMRAFNLRHEWESAVLTQAGGTADGDAAYAALVEYLDAHGLTGKKYDPRHRTEPL